MKQKIEAGHSLPNIRITDRVTEYYLNSNDFNGYPVRLLEKEFGLDNIAAKTTIIELIRSRSIDIVLGNYHPNTYIKAFSEIPPERQLSDLDELEFSDQFCLYPSAEALAKAVSQEKFNDQPFTKELMLGAGQLDYRVFDLSVLEHYRNDPRYYYETDFISGKVGVTTEFFESPDMPDHDQVLLQTFGFAFDDDMSRYVAVFLRYLRNGPH